MSSENSKVKDNLALVDADDLLNGDQNDLQSPTSTLKPLKEEPSEKDLEDYRAEYAKIQDDINTLRLVLNEKLKREQELKTLLGISFVDEIREDFKEGFNTLRQTTVFMKAAETLNNIGTTVTNNDAYQKTTAGLKTATQKITPAFQTIGSSFKTKLGDMRNSAVFKSVEGKLGNTFSTVMNKMKGSRSEYGIEDNETNGTIGATNGNGGSTLPKAKTQDVIAALNDEKHNIVDKK